MNVWVRRILWFIGGFLVVVILSLVLQPLNLALQPVLDGIREGPFRVAGELLDFAMPGTDDVFDLLLALTTGILAGFWKDIGKRSDDNRVSV